MKMFQTVLGVTGITVQPGTQNSQGKPVRDVIISTAEGDLVVHLLAESREDLQVQFAGNDQPGWKQPAKKQLAE